MWDFFSYRLFHENDVGDVFLLAGAIFLTIILARVTQHVFKGKLNDWAKRTETNLDDMLLATFEKPIYWIVVAGGLGLAIGILQCPLALSASALM